MTETNQTAEETSSTDTETETTPMLLSQTTRRRKVLNWLEKVIDVKVKALLLTALVSTFVIVGFQYQVSALNNHNLEALKRADRAACEARVFSRTDLRDILFEVIDLSDVLPDSEGAALYEQNRIKLINEKFPALSLDSCTNPAVVP